MSTTNPTREPETVQAYLKKAAELETQAAAYYELHDGPVAPSTLVNYLISQLPTKSPATVRYYKASLRCFFEKIITEGDEEGLYTEALTKLEEVHPVVKRRDLPQRTSAKKSKSIALGDIIKLTDHVLAKDAFWPPRALRFLQAAIVTGLRPVEWQHAEWLSETSIIVRNAKHTNGRAHGITRTVDVPEEDWLSPAVKLHMDLLREWLDQGNTYEKYYQNCRMALQRCYKALWPSRKKNVTLYTGRHQFCANRKAEDKTPEQIAYEMGHGSTETAASHYGKKRHGWRATYRPRQDLVTPSLPAANGKPKNSPV